MSRSKTPSVEEIEDEDNLSKKNTPPKNPQHILERAEEVIEPRGHSSQEPSINDIDDEETYPTHAKKSRKRFKAKRTVVQSSNDSNDRSDLDQENQSNPDSDIDQNIKPEEDSEEELGKYLKLQKKKTYLYILKNGWRRIGLHPYMVFSKRVP